MLFSYIPICVTAGTVQKQPDPEPTKFTGNSTTSLSYARQEYIGVWLDTVLGDLSHRFRGSPVLVSHHHGLTSVASAVAPAPPFTLWQPEFLPLGTPSPHLRGSPCLLQR